MRLRTPLLLLSVLGCVSACHGPPSRTPAPAEDPEHAREHVPLPANATARLTAALATIEPSSVRADLERLVGPRHGATSAAHALEAIAYVRTELEKAGFKVVLQRIRDESRGELNVIAENAGQDPKHVVLATAHHDTVPESPGADDNASGVVTLLAIARAAKRMSTEASIRLIAFGLEEQGLRGSRHYARSLSAEERARIAGVYNFDMVAFTHHDQAWPEHADMLADLKGRPLPTNGNFIGAVSIAGGDHALLHALHEAQAFVPHLHVETLELPPIFLRFAQDLTRGDHASFWKIGVPAIAVGDTAELRNPNYHRPSDTLDTLDIPFATEVARWAAAGVILAAKPH